MSQKMKRLASRIESGWVTPEQMYAHLDFFETRERERSCPGQERVPLPAESCFERVYL